MPPAFTLSQDQTLLLLILLPPLKAALTQSLTFSTSTSRELLSFMQSYATKHRTASCLKRPHSSAVTFSRTSVPPLLYSSTVLSHSFNGKRILSHCPIFCQDLV